MKNNNTQNYSRTMPTRGQRFFWWCGGANINILQKYLNDWSRQTSSGVFVFIVAIIATISMTLVLAGVLEINPVISIFGGLFWGWGVILSLDRVFLTNYRKGKKEVLRTVFRLSVTIVFSLLITDSAVLYLFKDDIAAKIETRKIDDQKDSQENALTQAEHDELAQLNKDEKEQQGKIDRLNQDSQEKMEIRDAEGRGDKTYQRADGSIIQLSGKPSHASEYAERNQEYESAQVSLDSQKDENTIGTLANNLKRIRDRKNEFREKQNNAKSSLSKAQNTNRLLEMHDALFAILVDPKNVGARSFFILMWLGLILLESTPMFSKLITRKSPYEQALIREDNKAELSEKHDAAASAFLDRNIRPFY